MIVPVYSAFDPSFGECSGSKRLRPKSETFEVKLLTSSCDMAESFTGARMK